MQLKLIKKLKRKQVSDIVNSSLHDIISASPLEAALVTF